MIAILEKFFQIIEQYEIAWQKNIKWLLIGKKFRIAFQILYVHIFVSKNFCIFYLNIELISVAENLARKKNNLES